jgi:phospholipid/cholesterol/gamma-HCH transport system substrate-binding protein
MTSRKIIENKKIYKVGLFFLIGIIISIFGIFSIAKKQFYFESHYTLYTQFKQAGGLKAGSPVMLAGVLVGTVSDVVFPKRITDKYVHVTLSMTSKVQDKIRTDSVATIKTIGLLGDQYIDISFGSPDAFILESKHNIKSAEPNLLGDFLLKGENVLDNLTNASARLTSVLEKIDEGKGLAGSLVNEPGKYRNAIDNIADSADSIKKILKTINEGKGSLGSFIKDKEIYDNLESSSKSLSSILHKIDSGEGTLGKLVNDPNLYNELKTSSASLSKFTKDLQESKGPLVSLIKDEAMKIKLESSIANFQKSSESLKTIMEKIEKGEGSLGLLINDKGLYVEIKHILEGAKKSWIVRFFTSLNKKGKDEEAKSKIDKDNKTKKDNVKNK